jgi:shikimate kinase/REP element-mobilizing transposase RayT
MWFLPSNPYYAVMDEYYSGEASLLDGGRDMQYFSVMREESQNIVLIGMPGAGKSTVGVLLAKARSMEFVDTDVCIQAREKRRLQEIIDSEGLEEFRRIEARQILDLKCRHHVIATGGSVVYDEGAMRHLGRAGVVVHLDLPLERLKERLRNLPSRGVVMAAGQSLESLYAERQPLYRRYAQVTVDCTGLTHDEVVERICAALKSRGTSRDGSSTLGRDKVDGASRPVLQAEGTSRDGSFTLGRDKVDGASRPVGIGMEGTSRDGSFTPGRDKVDGASRPVLQVEGTSRDGSFTLPGNFFDPSEPVGKVHGNLPHWRQEGAIYFITFRLADSLPQEKLNQWLAEREEWMTAHPEPHDEATREEYYRLFPERLQNWLDAGHGSCVLARPEIKRMVEAALSHFSGERYRLLDSIVMPNHVHALVAPLGRHTVSGILHSWKSYTAHEILKEEGSSRQQCVWQQESFDHIVRNAAHLERIRQYIQDNPGKRKAGG